MRHALISFFAAACASFAFAANDGQYRLDLGTEVHAGNLKVEPTIEGPAGKTLRYEMRVRREGNAGSANSSQSGTVRLDDDGHGQLASNSISVTPADHYEITVRVYDAGRVVAEQTTRYP
jgi:hypothetical protein